MTELFVGKKIRVNVKQCDSTSQSQSRVVKVYGIYPHFVVLDTGKFKFCAYEKDIRRRNVLYF